MTNFTQDIAAHFSAKEGGRNVEENVEVVVFMFSVKKEKRKLKMEECFFFLTRSRSM